MSVGLFLKRYWAIVRGKSPLDSECQQLRKLASDYSDSDLSPELRVQLEKHLEMCQPCNGFLDSLRRTLKLLRGLPSEPVAPEMLQRILKRTQQ